MTARSEDLSAIFYNPAGIAYVEHSVWSCGLAGMKSQHTFEGQGSLTESRRKIFFPYYFYTARRINEKTVLGMGVYTPFGVGTEWGRTWNGRYVSSYGTLSTLFYNPVISCKINDMITIGCGASYVTSAARIESMVDSGFHLYHYGFADSSKIAQPAMDTVFSMKGRGSGASINGGVLMRFGEKIRLGASFRTVTNIRYKGTASFTHAETPYTVLLGLIMPLSQKGKTDIRLPWMLNIGAYYHMSEAWDASLDVHYLGWSVFDKLDIDLLKDMPSDVISMNKAWKDSQAIRFGSSCRVNEFFIVKGGIFYDHSPVPDVTFDALIPDADRLGLSFGAGYTRGAMSVDAGFLIEKLFGRTKDNEVGFQDINGDGVTDREDQKMLDGFTGGYPAGNGGYSSSENLVSLSWRCSLPF